MKDAKLPKCAVCKETWGDVHPCPFCKKPVCGVHAIGGSSGHICNTGGVMKGHMSDVSERLETLASAIKTGDIPSIEQEFDRLEVAIKHLQAEQR